MGRGQKQKTNENLFLKLKPFFQTLVLPLVKTHRAKVMKVDYCHSGLLEAGRDPALIPVDKPSHLPCLALQHPHCLRVQDSFKVDSDLSQVQVAGRASQAKGSRCFLCNLEGSLVTVRTSLRGWGAITGGLWPPVPWQDIDQCVKAS